MTMVRHTFKNIKQNMKRLVSLHKAQKKYIKFKEQEAEKKGLIRPILSAFNLKKALERLQRNVDKYYGNTSKYKPHQGKQECARRLRVGSPAWYSGMDMRDNGSEALT